MQHHFDIDIAKEYGILEAVLLDHFVFWTNKNEANGNNCFDGYYWTFNSMKAFAKLFPYASEGQIRRALKKLEENGLIITGNYNKSAYDRTTWYALTKNGKCICQKCKMEISETENGNSKSDKPIPYKDTDTDTYSDIYSQIVNSYNKICMSLPKCIKLTDKRKRMLKKRLEENSYEDIVMAFRKAEDSEFLSGRNGKWQACNFDWFIGNPDNIVKTLEGKYDDKPQMSREDQEFARALNNIRSDADGDEPCFGE